MKWRETATGTEPYLDQARASQNVLSMISSDTMHFFSHSGSNSSPPRIPFFQWFLPWNPKSAALAFRAQVSLERTCAHGTAYMLSEPGAQLYEKFWTGPAQPLAYPQSLSLTTSSGQILKATVLVPKLPLTQEAPQYFSSIWFEACEEQDPSAMSS